MTRRKWLQQECPGREYEQEDIVPRIEIADEALYRHACLWNLAAHTARAIDYDPNRYRCIEVMVEESYRPLDIVDIDPEVVLLQSSDVASAPVSHGHDKLLIACLA